MQKEKGKKGIPLLYKQLQNRCGTVQSCSARALEHREYALALGSDGRKIMLSRIGTSELILILVIALVIFELSKLPEIGSAIGTSIKEFKKGISLTSGDTDTSDNSDTSK